MMTSKSLVKQYHSPYWIVKSKVWTWSRLNYYQFLFFNGIFSRFLFKKVESICVVQAGHCSVPQYSKFFGGGKRHESYLKA